MYMKTKRFFPSSSFETPTIDSLAWYRWTYAEVSSFQGGQNQTSVLEWRFTTKCLQNVTWYSTIIQGAYDNC